MTSADLLSIFLIAVSLSADCFAVALCGNVSRKSSTVSPMLRVSFSFGLFQTLMSVTGWFVGRTVIDFIEGYDHWAAFVLLAGIGGKMLWEAFHAKEECEARTDITKGLVLLTLSVATSIDSLAVGLSFAFIKVDIFMASLIIGLVAFVITIVGFLLGEKVGSLLGKRAEAAGGIILIGIGLKILLTDLLV